MSHGFSKVILKRNKANFIFIHFIKKSPNNLKKFESPRLCDILYTLFYIDFEGANPLCGLLFLLFLWCRSPV